MQHLRLYPLASPDRARAVAQHPASGTAGASDPSQSATSAAGHVTLRVVPDAPDPRPAHERGTGTAPAPGHPAPVARRLAASMAHGEPDRDGQDGSLVTEYGLLAVVAATVAGVLIQWASNGALVSLFNALLEHARSLVGA